MALNIPMPDLPGNALLKGLTTGGNLFTQIMQPILEREKQKQLENHFQEQLKLHKAAAGRASALFPMQLQALKDKHAMAEFDRNMMNQLLGLRGASEQAPIASEGMMPTEQMGQGLGIFTPEGLAEAQTDFNANVGQPKKPEGFNIEALKSNPMLRAWAKHHFGVDLAGGQGSGVYHGPARDAYDLERLRKEVGEDSPVYQNALASYKSTVDARQDLRDLRQRTKQGLKPGEKEFFDPQTGEPLGKEIPLTEKERESEEGNSLFNSLYPYVYKGAAPFSGENSIKRLEDAAAHYSTDPRARQLFDDFLLSEKMLAATTVNEASTLKAGRTNRTYNMLKESLEAQDIPNVIKKLVKQYQIPASAQLKAAMRYQKLLSDARNKAKKAVPATQKLFYNPERQAQYQDKQGGNEENADTKKVIVIDPNGKRFSTTEANAANLPEGWKRG